MAPIDPHSFTDSSQPHLSHIHLCLYFDFRYSTIHATARLTLSSRTTAEEILFLDTRDLTIYKILNAETLEPLQFSHGEIHDPIKGQCLSIILDYGCKSLLILYSTNPKPSSSTALKWVPLLGSVYTQCFPIYARSVFPCQDTPAVHISYTALLNIPRDLTAIMFVTSKSYPQPIVNDVLNDKLTDDLIFDLPYLWHKTNRKQRQFGTDEKIPPYLVGFLVSRSLWHVKVGPRSRVYLQTSIFGANELKDAFGRTEEMIRKGENLLGHNVERLDFCVLLPTSFCEGINPRMVLLSPGMISGLGNALLAIARPLAYCWFGNLITHRNNEHLWLTEGFATYMERRIVEAVLGEDRAPLSVGIAWKNLNEEMERFKDNMEFTRLKTKQDGVDPTKIYSIVPSEKGYYFLRHIEHQVGRDEFDEFLKTYIGIHKFSSVDTSTFLDLLKACFPRIKKKIDLPLWTEGTGIPPDVYEPVSAIYNRMSRFAIKFCQGRMLWPFDWRAQEWELFLLNLPKSAVASQVIELDNYYRLSETMISDVKVAYLRLALQSGCIEYDNEVETTLYILGGLKYLSPLYNALLQGTNKEKELAYKVFAEARHKYHPIVQCALESIFARHPISEPNPWCDMLLYPALRSLEGYSDTLILSAKSNLVNTFLPWFIREQIRNYSHVFDASFSFIETISWIINELV